MKTIPSLQRKVTPAGAIGRVTAGMPASTCRSRPFARCLAVSRRPLALALLLAAVPGAMLAPSTASAQSMAAATEAPATAAQAQAAPESAVDAVDINTASADELADRLSGVGASKAEAIIRYREQFGPFESVDELSEVTGIGAATVERNRERIRLR